MEDRLAALEQRMDRLEQQQATTAERPSSLELLQRLQGQSGSAGTVVYAGTALLGDGEYVWAAEHEVADLMETDWTAAATTLESMGSPPRLALLAALVGGPRSSAELQETLGTSTGHLYHHLRELQRAGLIMQRRRGAYEVVSRAVIPLLAILAAALDVSGTEHT